VADKGRGMQGRRRDRDPERCGKRTQRKGSCHGAIANGARNGQKRDNEMRKQRELTNHPSAGGESMGQELRAKGKEHRK